MLKTIALGKEMRKIPLENTPCSVSMEGQQMGTRKLFVGWKYSLS